jgi:hypothetical protein
MVDRMRLKVPQKLSWDTLSVWKDMLRVAIGMHSSLRRYRALIESHRVLGSLWTCLLSIKNYAF